MNLQVKTGRNSKMTGYKEPPKSGQFTKGDPRINRKGRPKKSALLYAIFKKQAFAKADNFMLPDLTCLEAIAHDWLNSDDYKKQRAALEIIFGKLERGEEENEPEEKTP